MFSRDEVHILNHHVVKQHVQKADEYILVCLAPEKPLEHEIT